MIGTVKMVDVIEFLRRERADSVSCEAYEEEGRRKMLVTYQRDGNIYSVTVTDPDLLLPI